MNILTTIMDKVRLSPQFQSGGADARTPEPKRTPQHFAVHTPVMDVEEEKRAQVRHQRLLQGGHLRGVTQFVETRAASEIGSDKRESGVR